MSKNDNSISAMNHHRFMEEAIALSRLSVRQYNGGPFGAVVVKDEKIIATGHNKVTLDNDPTAHAEVVAIRNACRHLQSFQLNDCIIYTSCEPCPMCLGAIYWARIERAYYANTKNDAANIGFSDLFIYQELDRAIEQRKLSMTQLLRDEALKVFQEWQDNTDKIEY